MKQTLLKFSQLITNFTLPLLALILPLFFLTTTPNFFDTNKLLLLVIASSIVFIAWLGKIIAQRSVRITLTPFTTPLAILALIYLLSSIFASPNTIEAFMGRGLLIPLLSIMFISFTSAAPYQTLKSTLPTNKTFLSLIISTVILSFIAIFQTVGLPLSSLLNKLFTLNFPTNLNFTPAGAPLALITLTLPVAIITIYKAISTKDSTEKITLFALTAVMATSLILNTIHIAPGKPNSPILLPFNIGWNIAIDTFKAPKTAFLGFGPESFVNAFTRFRPATFNLTDNWNLRFTASSNEPFHLLTTVGLIGLGAWVLLLFAIIKLKPKRPSTTFRLLRSITLIVFLIQLFLPANLLLIFLTFLLLTLLALELKAADDPQVTDIILRLFAAKVVRPGHNLPQTERPAAKKIKNEILPFVISLPLLAGAIYLLYLTSQAYTAEMIFKRSLDAVAANDGTSAYNLQRDTVLQNPFLDRYRRAYANTNLAIANALASQSQLSDQERSTVTQLIQQAIREAKQATVIDNQKTSNWETLATIYRNLINVAANADQWSVAAYVTAIQTDPVNPQLRLELGGIYFALGQHDQAIRFFQQATELKPDWPNAYYNLSTAYREKKDFQNALTNMKKVLDLVDKDSADYTKAQTELNDLQEQLNLPPEEQVETEEPESQLSIPSPLPSPQPPQSQFKLPEDAAPESTPGPETVETLPTQSPTPQ